MARQPRKNAQQEVMLGGAVGCTGSVKTLSMWQLSEGALSQNLVKIEVIEITVFLNITMTRVKHRLERGKSFTGSSLVTCGYCGLEA